MQDLIILFIGNNGCRVQNLDGMTKQFLENCNCQIATETCVFLKINENICNVTNEACLGSIVSFASIFKFAVNAEDEECKHKDTRYQDAMEMWDICSKGM